MQISDHVWQVKWEGEDGRGARISEGVCVQAAKVGKDKMEEEANEKRQGEEEDEEEEGYEENWIEKNDL